MRVFREIHVFNTAKVSTPVNKELKSQVVAKESGKKDYLELRAAHKTDIALKKNNIKHTIKQFRIQFFFFVLFEHFKRRQHTKYCVYMYTYTYTYINVYAFSL